MVLTYLQTVGLGTAVGVGLGMSFAKSGITDRHVIKQQAENKDWTWNKLCITSAATGTALVALKSMFYPTPLYIKPYLPYASIVGGGILGVGMYVAGADPTVSFAKLGAGDNEAPWILSGGVIGALCYGLIDHTLKRNTFLGNGGELCTLSGKLNQPFLAVAIPVTIGLVGAAYMIEQMYPEKIMIKDEDKVAEFVQQPWVIQQLKRNIWTPYVAGVVLGILQLPSLMFAHTALGTSSVFTTIAGHIVQLLGFQNSHFAEHMYNKKSYWHIAVAVGTIIGSYVVGQQMLKKKKEKMVIGNPPISNRVKAMSFAGGFLMLFGARMADGCAFTHTSGLCQLACASFATIASVCAGGMVAAAIPSVL